MSCVAGSATLTCFFFLLLTLVRQTQDSAGLSRFILALVLLIDVSQGAWRAERRTVEQSESSAMVCERGGRRSARAHPSQRLQSCSRSAQRSSVSFVSSSYTLAGHERRRQMVRLPLSFAEFVVAQGGEG